MGAAALALVLAAPGSRAGTNQLAGAAGFSNVNPEILAILGPPGSRGLSSLRLNATSLPPAPFSTRDLMIDPATDPVAQPFAIDVDASASGIAHRVLASAQLGSAPRDDYYFLPVTSLPVVDEPAPDTELDVLECAGVIRVLFVDGSGAPVAVQGDRVTADSSAGGTSPLGYVRPGSTQKDLVVRGDGSTWTVRAEITYGSDPFTDRMAQLRSGAVTVSCDEIVDLPVVVTTPGSAELGAMTGRLDVLGEDEVVASPGSVAGSRSHVEASGPWRNLRADALTGPPSSGDWRLDNLVASSVVNPPQPYVVKAETAFGAGHAASTFTTPALELFVDAGATADAGDAFVIDPVRVTGSVVLQGPPPHPAYGSPLQEAWRAADRDGNGDSIPDDFARFFDSTCVTARGRGGIAPGATVSALGAAGLASIDGAYDPLAGSLTGTYRAVLGNLRGEPGFYEADELNLKLLDTSRPDDPPSFVDARVDVDEPGPQWELPGGGAAGRDRGYCFSQVTLTLTAPGGVPFYGPNATGTGSFAGTDFRGLDVAYDATLWWARGVPASIARAATSGQTTFLLPQGDWTIEPFVNVPVAGGGVTVTALPPFGLEIGCAQVLEATPSAHVLIGAGAPACASEGLLAISGRAHAGAGLATLGWSVNGGALQPLCVACGTDAPFAFDAPVAPGAVVVRVEAVDAAGARAAAELRTRVAAEPSDDAASPLRVAKDPAGLLVTWEPEPRDTFTIHAGTLPSLAGGAYDHDVAGGCGRAGTSATLPMPAGDAYLLVTSSCGSGESSYGRDSQGAERPASPNACR